METGSTGTSGSGTLVGFRGGVDIDPGEITLEVLRHESQDIELEVLGVEVSDEVRQCDLIPAGIERQLVVGDDQRLALRLRQMPQANDRDFPQLQALRGFQPAVPGNDRAVRIDQDRIGPAELPDARGDLVDLTIGVRAWVAGKCGQR